MKKALIVLSIICAFILGLVFSDLLLETVNKILNDEVFSTQARLEERLQASQDKVEELEEREKKRSDDLSGLLKEMNSKDYLNLAKEALLTASAIGYDTGGKILLQAPTSEMLFATSADADPVVNQIREGFNDKVSNILDVSKGIFRQKLSELDMELVNMNNRLKQKNLELVEKLIEVEKYKGELEKQREYITALENIREDLKKTVGDLETKIENGRLRVSFKGDILFASGSHQLKKEGIRLLDSVLPILRKSSVKNDIFIAGHTDNVPIRPDARDKYASNWDLSTYRAIEVVKYLTGQGIPPRNLTAAGYGEYKPVDDNHTEAGRSRNRRVELYLIPKIIKRDESEQ